MMQEFFDAAPEPIAPRPKPSPELKCTWSLHWPDIKIGLLQFVHHYDHNGKQKVNGSLDNSTEFQKVLKDTTNLGLVCRVGSRNKGHEQQDRKGGRFKLQKRADVSTKNGLFVRTSANLAVYVHVGEETLHWPADQRS